jgi:hypothetical protein
MHQGYVIDHVTFSRKRFLALTALYGTRVGLLYSFMGFPVVSLPIGTTAIAAFLSMTPGKATSIGFLSRYLGAANLV